MYMMYWNGNYILLLTDSLHSTDDQVTYSPILSDTAENPPYDWCYG